MEIELKEFKKRINDDWKNAFPQLSIFSPNKFYKVVGPIILGLELVKLPRTDEYRPHFVLYSLWGNKIGDDLKACLAGPILLKEYYNKKNFQFSIPYSKHDIYFDEALLCVQTQTPILLDETISLKKLLYLIDEHSKTQPLSFNPHTYLQGALQEAKLGIALYKSITDAQHVMSQISKTRWDADHFKTCNVDLNEWLNGLQEKINHRDKFLKQISVNKHDKKIQNLNQFEIID
jgi:hypothetical protein